MGSVVRGKTIGQTFVLDEDIAVKPKIALLQCPFLLCEADYVRLTQPGSKVTYAAFAILLLSAGWGIPMVAKFMSAWFSRTPVSVQTWEYWGLAIGIVAAAILFIISACVPNEKREVLRDMKEHFRSNPPRTVTRR